MGGLLVLMLILLLLIVVVVVCVRRRAQGKTIQDTHSQGKTLLNMEVYTTHTACLLTYTYNYTITVVYFTTRSLSVFFQYAHELIIMFLLFPQLTTFPIFQETTQCMGFLRTGLKEQIHSLQKQQQSLTTRYMAARNHSTMQNWSIQFMEMQISRTYLMNWPLQYQTMRHLVPVYDNVQKLSSTASF